MLHRLDLGFDGATFGKIAERRTPVRFESFCGLVEKCSIFAVQQRQDAGFTRDFQDRNEFPDVLGEAPSHHENLDAGVAGLTKLSQLRYRAPGYLPQNRVQQYVCDRLLGDPTRLSLDRVDEPLTLLGPSHAADGGDPAGQGRLRAALVVVDPGR